MKAIQRVLAGALAVSALLILGRRSGAERPNMQVVRVGYLPNITHAQALIGLANGAFDQVLGEDVEIRPFMFNAGPSVIEALFAGELDIAYIGPNPAINGYVKSKGEALRIVAGAASGGAVFVVRSSVTVNSPADLAGKRLATPQLGNTQDVALRYYLKQHGLETKDRGGSVEIAPMQNADILTSFLRKEVDGAWVPEPWGARLVHDAQGNIFLDERDLWPARRFATAVVIVRTKFLKEYPGLVKGWLAVHSQVTEWIRANPEEAKRLVNAEIAQETGKVLSDSVINDAWSRLELTAGPMQDELLRAADQAFELGFLGKEKPDLSSLFDLTVLEEATAAK